MGSVVSGLFGKGGSGIAGQGIKEAARRAESAYFKPYTVTTGTGTTSYGNDGFNVSLSPEYQKLLGTSLGGAQGLFDQFASFDPSARAGEIFGEQSALLQPEFQRQATELQSTLFGRGTLGKKLAGESVGLGRGAGMVQADALGLGQAQQQTLANLAAQSRNQAFGEQAQLGQMATGALQSALGISNLEQSLMGMGLNAEQARAAAALGAGNLAISPYATAADMAQRQQESNAGFFGSLVGGIGTAGGFGGFLGGAGTTAGANAALLAMSDVRIKQNIQHVDTLSNGIKVDTWEWNELAPEPAPGGTVKGVIAQEILEQFPEAVLTHDSGYLMVDYSHPELQGVH